MSETERGFLAAVLVVLLAAAAAGGGYALGVGQGEDLERAKSEGAALGKRTGGARGAETGYRAGLKAGHRAGYRKAYKRALEQEPPAPAASLPKESCGDLATDGAGTYTVESVGVECGEARQVAEQWEEQCADEPSGDCQVSAGFYCNFEEVAIEQANITCASGNRRVTFESGA